MALLLTFVGDVTLNKHFGLPGIYSVARVNPLAPNI